MSGWGETCHTNVFLFHTPSHHKQKVDGRARPRYDATNLHCTPASKRLKFLFRTVGLVLHNNIRKAMAVAWPMGALGYHSWAYCSVAIGPRARVDHSICRCSSPQSVRAIVDCRHCVDRATAARYARLIRSDNANRVNRSCNKYNSY